MGRRFALLSGLAAAAAACTESVTSPGPCPEFCPPAEIVMVDTLLTAVVDRDTSFTGYVLPHEATTMQVVGPGMFETRGLIRFARFGERVPLDSLTTAPVAGLDSFRLDLRMLSRTPDATGLQVTVHRVPISVDSTSTYAAVEPSFHDSTVIGTIQVADTSVTDTISVLLAGDAFPTFEDDGFESAIGLAIRTDEAFVTLGTTDSTLSARLTRFVQADSGDGVQVPRSDSRAATFDTFVLREASTAPTGVLRVGGSPSARAFLRVNLPAFIIDESEIVRATLLLVPVEPARGPGGDSVRVLSNTVGADFGAKSPIQLASRDAERAVVAVGSTDTVDVDFTRIVGLWQAFPRQDRTLVISAAFEAGSPAELRFGSSQMPEAAPAIRLTFIPPFSFAAR